MYTIKTVGDNAVVIHEIKNIGQARKRTEPLGPNILTETEAPRLPRNAPNGANPPFKMNTNKNLSKTLNCNLKKLKS